MNGLHQQFGEQIDFIKFNVNNPDTQDIRLSFGMRGRSHYVLTDGSETVLKQWFGPLREEQVTTEIEEALASFSN